MGVRIGFPREMCGLVVFLIVVCCRGLAENGPPPPVGTAGFQLSYLKRAKCATNPYFRLRKRVSGKKSDLEWLPLVCATVSLGLGTSSSLPALGRFRGSFGLLARSPIRGREVSSNEAATLARPAIVNTKSADFADSHQCLVVRSFLKAEIRVG